MDKADLRKIYLARQKSLSPGARAAKSGRLAARFFQSFDLSGVKFLHCFLPIEKFGEVDTRLILRRVWDERPRVQTVAPRADLDSFEMLSAPLTAATELARNAWQMDEPAGGAAVAPEKIDLVLVPLISFDRRGFRVGHGKGFYDRFLKNCRPDCPKIGLSFFAPVAKIRDAGGHDVKLDFCLTPAKTWRF